MLVKTLFLLVSLAAFLVGADSNTTAAAGHNMESFISIVWEKINATIFVVNDAPVSLFKILVAVMIFVIGVFVGGYYKLYINKLMQKSHSMTMSTKTLLSNVGYYLILMISIVFTLNFLGINLSSIAFIAGALSVGIGFGLQNIVSNFISGIILMFERSIKIGDYIELSGDLRGRVSDIRMRSTTVTTNSNIDIIVPNQSFIENNVINWTMNDEIRRFDIPFGVAYGTNPQKVIDVVLDAVKKSGFNDIYLSNERITRVVMTSMGDSSVNFELLVWLIGSESLYPKRTTSRFMILIYNALYENNIQIPFPQMDLHVKELPQRM